MKDQGLSAADSLLCAVLQGHLPAWPEGLDGDLLLMRSDYHGVAPHMHERMSQSDWPAAVLDALRLRVQSLAMWELRHHQYMAEAVAALAMAGAEPLVIKGTGLAYSLYTNPVLRPRADTDILISASSGAAAHMCLTRLGFRRASAVHGDFASYQATYQKAAPEGGTHALDLHWKINNSEVLARVFGHDELRDDSVDLAALCPGARTPSAVHALLIACMHRLTHKKNPYYMHGRAHFSADRLIWLNDIAMLASGLGPAEWRQAENMARQKGLLTVCLDGLTHAAASLGGSWAHVRPGFAADGDAERPYRYLASGILRQACMDLQALQSWHARLNCIKEHAFPPSDYLRIKYAGSSQPLWWLYARRATSGLLKRLRWDPGH